jgi:hypothetical protein
MACWEWKHEFARGCLQHRYGGCAIKPALGIVQDGARCAMLAGGLLLCYNIIYASWKAYAGTPGI